MYELRRGVNDAKTFSINFSMDSSLLCSISSRGTCHIWKLDDSDERKSKFIEGKRSISQIQIPDFNSKLQSKKIKDCVGKIKDFNLRFRPRSVSMCIYL